MREPLALVVDGYEAGKKAVVKGNVSSGWPPGPMQLELLGFLEVSEMFW